MAAAAWAAARLSSLGSAQLLCGEWCVCGTLSSSMGLPLKMSRIWSLCTPVFSASISFT